MQFSLLTTFKSNRTQVQMLTATDKADAREHAREVARHNANVRKVEVSSLGAYDKPFYSITA